MSGAQPAPGASGLLKPMAPFIRDEWYVAAFSDEVADAPLGRTICGEAVVLFRAAGGAVAVLEDRCSHRKFPLSRGKVIAGGVLQCGYHGACFDGAGSCVSIPGRDVILASFNLRHYPVIERDGVIFVWMGAVAAADRARPPDWHRNVAADWTAVRGRHRMPANYQLVLDNLLDLTHVAFIHKMLGGPGITENPLEFSVDGETVHTFRMMRNVEVPGIYAAMGRTGKIDRWQKQRVAAPSYVYFESGAEPVGSNRPAGHPHHVVIQGVTPETETSTHYFWTVARSFARGDETVSRALYDITSDAFDEDVAALEAQQRSIDADRSGRPFGAFACDAAGLAVRRILARRLAREAPG